MENRFRGFTSGERGALHWALETGAVLAARDVFQGLEMRGRAVNVIASDAKDAATLARLLLECVEMGDD